MRQRHTERVFDELLVTAAKAGNAKAASRLAMRWQPRLLRTARRILRNDEMAHEAVQEAWVGICRGWIRLSDPAKFPAWAFGILQRKCADRLRQHIQGREANQSFDDALAPAVQARAENLTAIDQAFATLSAEHRIAATLFFGEGLTLHEIAMVTDVPVGTAKSRIFHARQQLKAVLIGDEI